MIITVIIVPIELPTQHCIHLQLDVMLCTGNTIVLVNFDQSGLVFVANPNLDFFNRWRKHQIATNTVYTACHLDHCLIYSVLTYLFAIILSF